jgi:Lrp/AsnC family transcriptional regulator
MKRSFNEKLDQVDRRILQVLQAAGSLSAADVAVKVNVTATTCWRRISRLESAGIIKQRVALLNRSAVGLNVMIFAHVKLSMHGRDALAKFDQAMQKFPEVLECYSLLGEWDFLLRIVAKDIQGYESFFLDHLSKIPLIQSVNSSMVLTTVKETTAFPVG